MGTLLYPFCLLLVPKLKNIIVISIKWWFFKHSGIQWIVLFFCIFICIISYKHPYLATAHAKMQWQSSADGCEFPLRQSTGDSLYSSLEKKNGRSQRKAINCSTRPSDYIQNGVHSMWHEVDLTCVRRDEQLCKLLLITSHLPISTRPTKQQWMGQLVVQMIHSKNGNMSRELQQPKKLKHWRQNLKCIWHEKYFLLIWKAFQNTEEWHFSFWNIFFRFRDIDVFLLCKLDQGIGCLRINDFVFREH